MQILKRWHHFHFEIAPHLRSRTSNFDPNFHPPPSSMSGGLRPSFALSLFDPCAPSRRAPFRCFHSVCSLLRGRGRPSSRARPTSGDLSSRSAGGRAGGRARRERGCARLHLEDGRGSRRPSSLCTRNEKSRKPLLARIVLTEHKCRLAKGYPERIEERRGTLCNLEERHSQSPDCG